MVKPNRDEYIVNNLGLVHAVAKRFLDRGVEYEDIYQAGCIGLIKAVDRFDEGKGFAFSTYAVPVIMGEIKRVFRDGGAIKVSRSLKEKSYYVQSARERFRLDKQREPTVSELSCLTGIKEEDLPEILNVINPVLSLSSDEESDLDVPIDESDKLFDRLSVRQAIEKLNIEEQLLIKYRFYEEKTQTQTAKLMGISQVQVSRKEKALLSRLKIKLSA